MKKVITFPILIFFFIIFIFLYLLIIDRNPSELPSTLINKKVPDFKAESLLKKKTFNSLEEFGNETVLVNFFATWCKPCLDEHIFLKRLSREKGLRIVGINYKDNPNKAIKWIQKLGNPYSDILVDSNAHIGIDWGVYGIPETFIVNSKSIVKHRLIGPITKKNYNSFYSKIKESEKQ